MQVMEMEQRMILELLYWVKDSGFWPERFRNADMFVVPISNTIVSWGRLEPHQKAIALWLPSRKTLGSLLEKRGMSLEARERDGIHFVELGKGKQTHQGVGVGMTEALLSALNAMRRDLALAT